MQAHDRRYSEDEDEITPVMQNSSSSQARQNRGTGGSHNTEQVNLKSSSYERRSFSDGPEEEYEIGQATPCSIITPQRARVVTVSRPGSAATMVTSFPMQPAENAPHGSSNTFANAFPLRSSSVPLSTPDTQLYGGLINANSPSVYSVAASAYNSSNDDKQSSLGYLDSAMPSPLDTNRSLHTVMRGFPTLHSSSTSSLAPRVRSQVAAPEYSVPSILAGLERMLSQSGQHIFNLNDAMIVHLRFEVKPKDDQAKFSSRIANLKAKLAPKRAPEISAPFNLRSAFQEGRSNAHLAATAIFDPTIEAVRKVLPEELTDNLKALVAIIISVRYLDKLPVTDPDSPLSWSDAQLSPELVKPSNPAPAGFQNAPPKARAMLGMEKGMKGLAVHRSSSEVFGGSGSSVAPYKGRDRVEKIQLGLKALAKHMIKDALRTVQDDEAKRLFVAITEIVRLSEGFE